jgi:hypothetical protein
MVKGKPKENKQKITISIDDQLLRKIDGQRGNVKRSTYINTIVLDHFNPRPPEDEGGGTFVTTLELRKTLKSMHNRLQLLDALAYNVKDLEAMVYASLFDVSDRKPGKKSAIMTEIEHHSISDIYKMGAAKTKAVAGWIDSTIKDKGGIKIARDFKTFVKLAGVEKTEVAMTKLLREYGLVYNKKSKEWKK